MAENIFPKGIRVFAPHAKAPAWVKGSLVITLNELVQFGKDNPELLTEYNGQKQLKLKLQESKDGKLNVCVDTYKPGQNNSKEDGDSLPF